MKDGVSAICEKCTNLIFDEKWGEYKCLYFQHKLYDIGEIVSCDHKNKRRKKNENRS